MDKERRRVGVGVEWGQQKVHPCPPREICHSILKSPKGLISSYLILLGKCVEDATCDVLGTKNECPNGVCYDG